MRPTLLRRFWVRAGLNARALGMAGLLAAFATPAQAAPEAELVFIAATNHAEPWSTFRDGRLSGGIVKDLGDALAQALGRRARYLSMPSKRAPQALRDGVGDVLCYTRAAWIGPDFQFSQPVFDNAEVVAARASAPPLQALTDLRGLPVGTVLGYRHPEVDAALGAAFRRQDAVDMASNLRMLRAGRHDYALTDRLTLRDLQRRHPDEGLREALAFQPFQAVCAVSWRSSLPLKELDSAIERLQRQGVIAALLRRYAP